MPDAWVDHDKTKIGYEIPLTRQFYRYVPPRPLAEIDAEIKALEEEIQRLLRRGDDVISDGPSVVHLASFVNGYPYKPDDLGDEGVPVIRIRQLLDARAAVPSELPRHSEQCSSTTVTSSSLGRPPWPFEGGDRGRALLNQHLFRVEPRPGVDTAMASSTSSRRAYSTACRPLDARVGNDPYHRAIC